MPNVSVNPAGTGPQSYSRSGEAQKDLKTYNKEYGDPTLKDRQRGEVNRNEPSLTVSQQDSFSADTVRHEQSGTGPYGINHSAYAEGPGLDLTGQAEATVGRGGIDIQLDLQVDAHLAKAGASAEKTFSVDVGNGETLDVTVDLAADGVVGANGEVNLNVHIGRDGKAEVSAGVQGFAGAKASLTGGVSVSHEGREIATADATISGTVGVSGQANAYLDVGLDGVAFGATAEATVGAGAGFEVNGEVNPLNVGRLITEAAV